MRSLACLVALFPAVLLAQPAAEQPGTGRGVAAEPGTAPERASLKLLDLQFARRGTAAAEQEHGRALEEALEARPDDFELLWRAARLRVWQAAGMGDDRRKEETAKAAWELADRARKLRPDDARGHYYAASGVGLYAQAIGILNAINQGIEGKFNERLDQALQLDPTVEQGGPWMAKGRYHYELPWPMRDLRKSRALLEQAVAVFPANARAHLYLAETLLKDGRAQEAKAAFARAMTVAPDDPDSKRVREMAKKLEAEIARAE